MLRRKPTCEKNMKTKVEIIKTSGLLSAILQLQRAIQLGENLQNRGIVVEIGYLRCKEVKSPMHTYFHCDFAHKVWKYVPLALFI